MAAEIRVPNLGESVTEATVSKWFKQPGDAVAQDEPVAELETDKVTMEVPAPAAGALKEIKVQQGQTVEVGAVLGLIEAGAAGAKSAPAPAAKPAAAPAAAAPAAPIPHPAKSGVNPATDSGPAVSKL